MPNSNGLKIQSEMKEAKAISLVLKKEEQDQLSFIVGRIDFAKSQREMPLHEFNGLDFLTDDQYNRDIRNSFIRPKLNDDEVRINTGTVEKKMMSVVNEILNLNMQPEIQVFDENDKMIQELGEVFTNLVKRTNEQEDEDDLMFPMLWDLATRRIMFCEEYQEEKEVVDKRKKKYDLEKGEIEFETKTYKVSRPRKRIIDSRSILLGDMSLANHLHNQQPFLVKYDRKHRREAWGIYHNFKNWQYVKAGGPALDNTWFGGQFDWRMYSILADEEVEIITYYSYPDDEYQIIINGVPMLPPSTPLSWEYEGYSIQAFVSREMEQNLAYGQLFTINAKVLAGVSDEMLRLIIRKWRQSIEPPTVVKGKKVLSRDIWNPGASASGISKDDIQKLIDNPGVTQSEMNTFNMITDKIETEIGVSKLFQGMTDKKMTATQALEQMKQAIKAIGVLVLSWAKVIRVMTYLRIYNIIENNTDPVDVRYENGEVEKIYKFFTIDKTKLDNDTTGSMMIEFSNNDLTPEEENKIYNYEEEEAKRGNFVRYKRINVDKLRQFRLHWFVTVMPQEKESTALQKILFTDQLNQAVGIMNITGRKIKSDTLINDYERIWKKRNMFEQAPVQPQQMSMESVQKGSEAPPEVVEASKGGMENTPMAGQMEEVVSGSIKRPSVNSAVGQAGA
jgi:hypothetical protein